MNDPVFLALVFGFGGFVGGIFACSVFNHFRVALRESEDLMTMWFAHLDGRANEASTNLQTAMKAAEKPKARKRAPAKKKPAKKRTTKTTTRKPAKKGR